MRTKAKGDEIRRLREAQGLGCTQLAEKVQISRSTLNRIEIGRQDGSPLTRYRIAQALGVDLSTITYEVPSDRIKQAA